MESRTEKRSLKPHQRYLSLLDVASVQELENRIVSEVLHRVRKHSFYERFGAVRLSRVVDSFDIDPIPQFDAIVPDGRLNYDRTRKRFVITLRSPHLTISDQSRELFNESHPESESFFTRRLRFTYAHEVAHRFCFIEEDGHWKRAITAAAARTNKSARFGVLSRLELNEERLCDRVAGRLLIPDDVLADYIEHRLSYPASDRTFDLHKELILGARMFQVSEDCLLVEMQRAVERGKLEFPANLCVLLIRPAHRLARSQIGPRKLRIRTAIMPPIIGNTGLKRVYPGLGAENLGKRFCAWISEIEACVAKNSGEASLPVLLRTDEAGGKDQEFKLNGWWKLTRREKSIEGILIWGILAQN